MRLSCSSFCRHSAMGILVMLVVFSTSCSWFKRGSRENTSGAEASPASVERLQLAPSLWLSPSATTAVLSYTNACGQPATLSIGAPLMEAVPKKLSRTFAGITPQYGLEETGGSDGMIEVGLGTKRIDLAIPQQASGAYPVTITLGIQVVFLSDDGTTLFSSTLQGAAHGDVEVVEHSCDVKGLEAIAREAIEAASDNLAKQVAGSARVREYAQQRAAAPPTAAGPSQRVTGPMDGPPGGGTLIPGHASMAAGAAQATSLAFLAIVRDESQNHLLEAGESLTIEVEVKNEGQVEAKDVELVVGGGGTVAEYFPPSVPIGTVQPGEIKYASITKQLLDLKDGIREDLLLSLRSSSPLDPPPPTKQFILLIKNKDKGAADVGIAGIDRPPAPLGLAKRAKAVAIAIGVGRFRDEHVPPVKYAGHDAEIIAAYLRTIGEIPADRIRLLLDGFALKEDLSETFDEWLPKRVDAATVVYVYFAGRALVDGATGGVSLVPYDGTTKEMRRLYPVRRIQETLSRLPIQRAIMMFEVSLDPSPGASPASTPHPDWGDGSDEERDHVMWMVGNRGLQEAHVYEPAKHGLFTYHLLRGLQGLADIDRDGTVVAGELCTYVRGEVIHAARELFGYAQQPLCSPPPGQGAVVRIHPMARGNNPKPPAPDKNTDPASTAPVPAERPMQVGPKL